MIAAYNAEEMWKMEVKATQREQLIDRFIDRTLNLMDYADGLEEWDYELEALIQGNYKAIQGVK